MGETPIQLALAEWRIEYRQNFLTKANLRQQMLCKLNDWLGVIEMGCGKP